MLNKLKNLFPLLNKNKILAIELADDAFRAVVVERQGKEAVVTFAAESSRLLSENIHTLLGQLGDYPAGVVLVSPEVKFLVSELPISSEIKIASDKLQEAVRWEAQTYLDFPAEEGLFGYHLQNGTHPIKKEFFNEVGRSGKTTPVLITAMSKQAYIRLVEVCKGWHLCLQGVYPKESVFVFSIDHFAKGNTKIGPQYAPVVSAALQRLKFIGAGKLGINNRVPLITSLKLRMHILPLVVVGIFTMGVLTHYVFLKYSFWRYSSRIQKIEIEKKKIEGNIATLKSLKSQIKDAYDKKRYVEEILPARHKALLDLFNGIADKISYDIILDRISQDSTDVFSLEGSGLSAGSITSFVGILGRLDVTREAKLEAINEKKGDTDSTGLFVYQFKIKVILK